MGIGLTELLVVLVVVLIVFGAGKLPKVMEDFGKGVKAFKDGVDGADASAPKRGRGKRKE